MHKNLLLGAVTGAALLTSSLLVEGSVKPGCPKYRYDDFKIESCTTPALQRNSSQDPYTS